MIRPASLVPAFGAATPLLRRAGIAAACGALLAILGPFGSYMSGGPVQRAGYWIGAMLLGLVLYGTAYRIVSASTPPDSPRWWPALIGAALLASLPEALVTRAAAFWLWPELAQLRLPPLLWFAQTATIGLVAMLVMSLVFRRSTSAPRDGVPSPPPAEADGVSLGADVLALQMEDHYVRVHRPNGSALILMPLARAIERVEAKGLRTHRSWWVASHAVTAVEGNARSMRLILSNGLVAPVARSAVTHLKAAGWIAAPESGVGIQAQASQPSNG